MAKIYHKRDSASFELNILKIEMPFFSELFRYLVIERNRFLLYLSFINVQNN